MQVIYHDEFVPFVFFVVKFRDDAFFEPRTAQKARRRPTGDGLAKLAGAEVCSYILWLRSLKSLSDLASKSLMQVIYHDEFVPFVFFVVEFRDDVFFLNHERHDVGLPEMA